MQNLSRLIVTALIGTTLVSCGGGGDDPPTAPVPVLTTLSVSFQTGAIQVGQSASASAAGLDQFGAAIATGTVSWSTVSAAVATINSSGLVTGAGAGVTEVIGSAGGKEARATVTVNVPAVANVYVTPPTATLGVGDTRQLVPIVVDANNNALAGRVVTWGSSDQSKATVSNSGLVTAVAAGEATITATSETKSGTALITVSNCNSSTALSLTVGQIRTLTAAETTSLCLGGGASASEYVLIPFNSTNVASATTPVRITAANTSTILPGQLVSLQPGTASPGLRKPSSLAMSGEIGFRERERRDISAAFASSRQLPLSQRKPRDRVSRGGSSPRFPTSFLTGIPPVPVVGDTYQINGSISGNTCGSAKQMRGARVVAVMPRTIVLSDVTSPANGYTDGEMTAFGQAFEDSGYPLDVANFGQPTDIDTNGRVAILFTPGVNVLSTSPGFVVGGAFTARDLFPATGTGEVCPASNEGEMFYMPVPDPGSTINGNYTNKDGMARGVLAVLVHELQHLINAGRRIYVNDAFDNEDVWLNEGLSHIAEELLYYQASGNTPRTNIDLPRLQSSQAQLDAVNAYMVQNLGRLSTYLKATETNSPFDVGDRLETRGAIWQLLRYSQDRKGGLDQATWTALVNSRESGQTNFNAVFGNIITMTRDWAVAQFADDSGLGVVANFTHPSWNYRSILPAINSMVYPLLTRSLTTAPVDIELVGGGAAYLRFRVDASVAALIAATSSGQPVPAAIEFILMRTQ